VKLTNIFIQLSQFYAFLFFKPLYTNHATQLANNKTLLRVPQVLNWLHVAQELLKIGMEKSSDSVRDIIMDFIRTGNIDKFKFMI
jgi:hypothetical protein